MAHWFVTFGTATPCGHMYWLPKSEGYAEARQETFDKFNTRWCMIYPIAELDEQRKRYGIIELPDDNELLPALQREYDPNRE